MLNDCQHCSRLSSECQRSGGARERQCDKPGTVLQRGMALVAVLWIVAALSIMVLGLTQTIKQSINAATLERSAVEGRALGEAAMQLALQQLTLQTPIPPGAQTIDVSYASVNMPVLISPLSGWISLSGASAPMLATVLQNAGGVDAGRAQQLAVDIVTWRDSPLQLGVGAALNTGQQKRGFECVEDLMQVPGMTYEIYSRIAPLLQVNDTASTAVNGQAAPDAVLQALQGNSAFVSQSAFFSGNLFRLETKVPLTEGKILHLTQDAVITPFGTNSVTPWRMMPQSERIETLGRSMPGG